MRRGMVIVPILLAVLLSVGIGVAAYNAGENQGQQNATEQIQSAKANGQEVQVVHVVDDNHGFFPGFLPGGAFLAGGLPLPAMPSPPDFVSYLLTAVKSPLSRMTPACWPSGTLSSTRSGPTRRTASPSPSRRPTGGGWRWRPASSPGCTNRPGGSCSPGGTCRRPRGGTRSWRRGAK